MLSEDITVMFYILSLYLFLIPVIFINLQYCNIMEETQHGSIDILEYTGHDKTF